MAKFKVLYNPKCNNNQAEVETNNLSAILKGDQLDYIDVLKLKDVKTLISTLAADESIIISGGDGTLNCFINDIDGIELKKRRILLRDRYRQ